ncbi:nucleotide exchange factor GrpE [Parvibaculum sp. MBR-TMA-1.3b-4.2]|jgi:molecular chaperone GrpE
MSDEEKKTQDADTPENAAPGDAKAEQAAAGDGAEQAAPETDLVGELEAQVSDLKDRLLRAAAEMENTRKRTERDKQDAVKFAAASFARDMLEVSDNLRRALAALNEDDRSQVPDSVKAMIEGVEMTDRQLLTTFERHGVREITPGEGEKFDPNLHEAMFEVPGTGQPAGTVVQVMSAGYMIGDRLLRAARVGVAKAEEGGGSGGPGANVDTSA